MLHDRSYRHFANKRKFFRNFRDSVLITSNFAFFVASLKLPKFWVVELWITFREPHGYLTLTNVYVRIIWHNKLACSNFCIPDTWYMSRVSDEFVCTMVFWETVELEEWARDSRVACLLVSKYQFYWSLNSLFDKDFSKKNPTCWIPMCPSNIIYGGFMLI